MNIKDAYDELLDELNNVTLNIDKLYGYEASVDTELNEKNLKLFDKLHQAIHAWGYSIEDQLIDESTWNHVDWRMVDETFENDWELNNEIDGNLDDYVGKEL